MKGRQYLNLRPQTHRVSRECTRTSDIPKAQPQENNSLEADSATCVRRSSIPEGVNVVLQSRSIGINAEGGYALSKKVAVVYPLRARKDFFASHEEVVGVGVLGILRIRHSVEWSYLFILQRSKKREKEILCQLGQGKEN